MKQQNPHKTPPLDDAVPVSLPNLDEKTARSTANEVAQLDKIRALKTHRKGRKPYRLKHPFTHGDYQLVEGDTEWIETDIVEFWMRRPILKDRFFAEKRAKDNIEYLSLLLIASTCSANDALESADEDLIGKLDAETDLIALLRLTNEFSGSPNIHKNTLTLSYPFIIKGNKNTPDKTLAEITLKRPKSMDFIKHKNETTLEKIARLAGYSLQDLMPLDFKTDWEGLIEIFNSFHTS